MHIQTRTLRSIVIGAVALMVFVFPIGNVSQVHAVAMTGESAIQSPSQYQKEIGEVYTQRTSSLAKTSTDMFTATMNFGSTLILNPFDNQDKKYFGVGAVETMGIAVAGLISNPPASAQVWLADILDHSPFVSQAYAQGIGFKSLNPILPIWKAFRDLSYVFFVVAFMIVGFLIMFRQKMGGQAAVTLTSALPNLIITLLAITFSYAIAGLVIDLMYLAIYLVVNVIKSADLLPKDGISRVDIWGSKISLEDIALSNNIFSNGLQLIFGGNVSSTTGNAAKAVGAIVAGFFSSADSSGSLSTTVGGLVGGTVNVLAYLIFAVAIFFAVTKTFFQLLMSYVMFLISVIFSPLTLMVGAFTGKTDYENWFKNLLASLLPFPVVITMIFLAMILAGQGDKAGWKGGDGGIGFQAPQISVMTNSGPIAATQGLLAIGILMLIPEAVKYSKDWLGAKSPFEKYMGDINANLKKGWEGGELVPGLGLKMGGAKQLIPEAISGITSTGTTAALGGVIGGYSQRGKGAGNIVLGTMGGAMAGAILPTAVKTGKPIVEKAAKYGEDVVSFIKTAERAQTVLTPDQVPESEKTKEQKAAVTQAAPTSQQTHEEDPGF